MGHPQITRPVEGSLSGVKRAGRPINLLNLGIESSFSFGERRFAGRCADRVQKVGQFSVHHILPPNELLVEVPAQTIVGGGRHSGVVSGGNHANVNAHW